MANSGLIQYESLKRNFGLLLVHPVCELTKGEGVISEDPPREAILYLWKLL